jgi:hypothetical protein
MARKNFATGDQNQNLNDQVQKSFKPVEAIYRPPRKQIPFTRLLSEEDGKFAGAIDKIYSLFVNNQQWKKPFRSLIDSNKLWFSSYSFQNGIFKENNSDFRQLLSNEKFACLFIYLHKEYFALKNNVTDFTLRYKLRGQLYERHIADFQKEHCRRPQNSRKQRQKSISYSLRKATTTNITKEDSVVNESADEFDKSEHKSLNNFSLPEFKEEKNCPEESELKSKKSSSVKISSNRKSDSNINGNTKKSKDSSLLIEAENISPIRGDSFENLSFNFKTAEAVKSFRIDEEPSPVHSEKRSTPYPNTEFNFERENKKIHTNNAESKFSKSNSIQPPFDSPRPKKSILKKSQKTLENFENLIENDGNTKPGSAFCFFYDMRDASMKTNEPNAAPKVITPLRQSKRLTFSKGLGSEANNPSVTFIESGNEYIYRPNTELEELEPKDSKTKALKSVLNRPPTPYKSEATSFEISSLDQLGGTSKAVISSNDQANRFSNISNNIESIIEADFEKSGNFALLQLTEKGQKSFGTSKVLSPLKKFTSVDRMRVRDNIRSAEKYYNQDVGFVPFDPVLVHRIQHLIKPKEVLENSKSKPKE